MNQNLIKSILLAAICLICEQGWTKPGFHKLSDPAIPLAVRNSAKSVFFLRFPVRPAFVPNSDEGKRLLSILKESEKSWDAYTIDVMNQQIQRCMQTPNSPCLVYDRGSAFIVGDTDHLWTALHCVGDFIQKTLDLANNEIKATSIHIPIQLFDESGKMVFGEPGDYAVLEYIDPLFSKGVKKTQNFMDYIRLRLSRSVTGFQPLEFASDDAKVGDPVYLVGYPRKTTDRISVKQPDADGQSVAISKGSVLEIDEGYRRWGENFSDLSLGYKEFVTEAELHFDGDCVDGNSGGAALNSDGKVVALFNSSTPKGSVSVDLNRSCLAVRANYLQNFTKIPIQ